MQIGTFTKNIIQLLQLNIPEGTPIYLGATNIAHMKSRHPLEYQQYEKDIVSILASPDYVGINKSDGSIEFVKEYLVNSEYIKVAVRVSASGIFYARSLYKLNKNRVQNFIVKGTLKKT